MKKTKSVVEKTETEPRAAAVKGGGFEWHVGQGINRNQWLGTEGAPPPRIKQLDRATFACYRDGQYLGCEETLALAFGRIEINAISEKNRVMRLWEREHPDELPPGLQLTDGERAEYWRRNPPRATAVRVTGRGASPRQDEDPATSRLRAELAAEGGAVAGGRRRRGGASTDASEPVGVIRVRAGAAVPKKPGSAAHGRWTTLWSFDGRTVADYRRARGNATTLANAIAKKFVTVEEK